MPVRPSPWPLMLTCFHTCRTRLPQKLKQCSLPKGMSWMPDDLLLGTRSGKETQVRVPSFSSSTHCRGWPSSGGGWLRRIADCFLSSHLGSAEEKLRTVCSPAEHGVFGSVHACNNIALIRLQVFKTVLHGVENPKSRFPIIG